MDRRGRGGSGDGPEYDIAREYEDVAGVVDAVAEATGSSVNLYGHSHGGIVAFGAATLTANLRKLVLYEGWPVPDPTVYALPPGLQDRMDALLAAGDRDGVVEVLFRGVENLSDEDMAAFKAAPSWPGRVAAAHTVTREVRGEQATRLSSQLAAKITVPVLMVTGEHSTDPAKPAVEAVAAALSDARIVVLQEQEHVADVLAPEAFAGHLIAFLRDY